MLQIPNSPTVTEAGFFFSVKGSTKSMDIKLNIKNLNRHNKIFTSHMYPVYMVSGCQRWQKIRERPMFKDVGESSELSFRHHFNGVQKIFFAFWYPYPYKDIMNFLTKIDGIYSSLGRICFSGEDIYYHRESLCTSMEGRSVDIITLTSAFGISTKREARLENLFPNSDVPRPHFFPNKKVVLISARVHPAETSSSYVFDGILTSLINKDDPGAALLRKKFVFKLIPVLNPDGIVKGHYRTDSRGVNLNRVYQCPSPMLHPSIHGICSLIEYYSSFKDPKLTEDPNLLLDGHLPSPEKEKKVIRAKFPRKKKPQKKTSRLFLYLDLHSHASRKGFFVYGNNFDKIDDCVESRLFAKLLEVNCRDFSYNACDFSESSMFVKDKVGDGTREGAGRVWVTRQTGLTYCYTFEAHYNSGIPETCIPRRRGRIESKDWISSIPSEVSLPTFESVGRAILQSILDLSGPNTWSRLYRCNLKSLVKIREALYKELSHKILYQNPVVNPLKASIKGAVRPSSTTPSAMPTKKKNLRKDAKKEVTKVGLHQKICNTEIKVDKNSSECSLEVMNEKQCNEASDSMVKERNLECVASVCVGIVAAKIEKSSSQLALENPLPMTTHFKEETDCCPPL